MKLLSPYSLPEKAIRWFLYALVTNGILLCLFHYLTLRALWLDEAFVAVNIKGTPLRVVFGSLEYGQQFPRIYLAIIWGLTKIAGYKIWTLRLLPFAFGVAGIAVWTRVLWRWGIRVGHLSFALLALLLFFTHSAVYYYAGEFKQYSAELFFSGYGIWFFERFLSPMYAQNSRRWALLCVGWLLPVFFSITYVLVLCAVGSCFFIPALFKNGFTREKWGDFTQLLLLSGLFIAGSYFIDIRYTDTNMLNSYWHDLFVNGGTFLAWFRSLGVGINLLIGHVWFNPLSWFYTSLALLGFFSIIKRNQKNDAAQSLLSSTAVMMLIEMLFLAITNKYPLHDGRLGLFYFPFAVVLIVMGVSWMVNSTRPALSLIGNATFFALLALSILWKIPVVSKAFYFMDHWGDINPSLKLLDASKSAIVFYNGSSEAAMRAYPELPTNFTFLNEWEYSQAQPWPPETIQRFSGEYYYLMPAINDSMDIFLNKLNLLSPHTAEPITPHLWFIHRK